MVINVEMIGIYIYLYREIEMYTHIGVYSFNRVFELFCLGNLYIYIYIYIYVYYMYIFIYKCVFVNVHKYICIPVFVCMCVYMCL